MARRVVLAYSGGLDTSVAVRWVIEELGVEVVALAVDVGQAAEDWDVVAERARAAGAVDIKVVDARREFAEDFVLLGAARQCHVRGSLPGCSPALRRARVIARAPGGGGAQEPERVRSSPRLHQASGANDQVRFPRSSTRRQHPSSDVIAPVCGAGA